LNLTGLRVGKIGGAGRSCWFSFLDPPSSDPPRAATGARLRMNWREPSCSGFRTRPGRIVAELHGNLPDRSAAHHITTQNAGDAALVITASTIDLTPLEHPSVARRLWHTFAQTARADSGRGILTLFSTKRAVRPCHYWPDGFVGLSDLCTPWCVHWLDSAEWRNISRRCMGDLRAACGGAGADAGMRCRESLRQPGEDGLFE